MLISRRTFGTLAGGVVLGALAGCGKPSGLEWLRSLDGVQSAEVVDDRIVLTVVERLADPDLRALVEKIKHDFRTYDEDYDSSIELAVDSHHARIYPSPTTEVDTDLERALWLRKDGRATSSTYGPSGMVVTAPASVVGAVALGFDQAVPSPGGRSTHRVESADRQVVVQWVDSPGLGFKLDRVAVGRFAELQRRYPGTTGWVEGPDRRAGVYFATADISLDALLGALPTGQVFGKLELGWGIACAPEADFPKAFTPRVRTLTAALTKVPGVTRLDIDSSGPIRVTVNDRAGYLGAISTTRGLETYLLIELVRAPSRYIGRAGRSVFRGSNNDKGAKFRLYSAVAANVGVTEVQLGANYGNLTVGHDITDANLAAALNVMAADLDNFALYVSQDPDTLDIAALGEVKKGTYIPPNPISPKLDAALIPRVTKAWNNHTAR
ncbi:hypothetical protein AB0L70_07565 [Kribbella sp. NPDC051952]|uniref:hypothetical protein n=1 Tax=Kribbella sp. NPDC051952 TaxID=3154851 RepID=UPI00344A6809